MKFNKNNHVTRDEGNGMKSTINTDKKKKKNRLSF